MHDIVMHDAFVPQGCERTVQPQPAVTVGAGTIGMQAYDAVTTKAGRYVQGGGCTTVCLGGLIQSGGFGSFSKHYGTAAGGLLEAEVVTADGVIRIANGSTNPDLFWALKGGGGGTFGVVSKMTLRVHDLPEFFGSANFTIKASSDDAYRRLIREFVSFYREHLFNEHWGEQAHLNPDNSLGIAMVSYGLDAEQAKQVWKPFLDWVKRSSHEYSIEGHLAIGSIPARHFWDVPWWKEHWPEVAFPNQSGNPLIGLLDYALLHLMPQPVLKFDDRAGAGPNNAWWAGDGGQVAWFIWGFESLWLPASLLEDNAQQGLADALFASSRYSGVELHFNKGLAGAPQEAIAAAKDTAMNPAVLNAFALAIVADGQGPAHPGITGHEPSVAEGRKAARRIDKCIDQLRAVIGQTGAYVSESNYFEKGWQQAYWGSNYARLAEVKRKYDPDGLFFVHNGVGSEQWSADGFSNYGSIHTGP
jgi:FAD/FMN-containing dehydrogenase